MNKAGISTLAGLSLLLALMVAGIPGQRASAQTCYDPKTQKEVPCERKRPTVIYPSFTPSATLTPTPTDTPLPTTTSTPAPVAIAGIATPRQADCMPYSSGASLGVALLGLGALTMLGGSRLPRSPISLQRGISTNEKLYSWRRDTERESDALAQQRAMQAAEQPARTMPGAVMQLVQAIVLMIVAVVIAIFTAGQSLFNSFARIGHATVRVSPDVPGDPNPPAAKDRSGSQIPPGLGRILVALSPRDPASGLPAMNPAQVAGAAQGAGTGMAGAGAGLLGAGLLAALLEFNCIGAPVLLPSAAAAGLLAALAALLVVRRGMGKANPMAVGEAFWPVGEVDESEEIRGEAGTYKPKDLE